MAAKFETGFFVRQPAWHELGTVLQSAPTLEEGYEISGLNWQVEQRRLKMPTTAGSLVDVDRYALARDSDDSVLGYCSEQYKVLQNREAFEWCRPLLESGKWELETAGSLCGGRAPWLLLKHGEFELMPKDLIKNYLMLYWSHDGTRSVRIMPTSVRVVCHNTLTQALESGARTGHCFRHSASMPKRMADVQQLYVDLTKQFSNQKASLEMLADVKLSEFDLLKYATGTATEMFGSREELEEMEDSRTRTTALRNFDRIIHGAAHPTGFEESKGTLYGAFNGIEETIEHVLGGRRVADRGSNILFGAGKKLADAAFKRAMQLV